MESWVEHMPTSTAWLRFVYTPVVALLVYVMYNLCHIVRRALATGVARPHKRLPPVNSSQHPIAYWSYVAFLSVLIIPTLAFTTALLVNAILRLYPPQH
jgi:hypothetical protein